MSVLTDPEILEKKFWHSKVVEREVEREKSYPALAHIIEGKFEVLDVQVHKYQNETYFYEVACMDKYGRYFDHFFWLDKDFTFASLVKQLLIFGVENGK